MRVPSFVRNLLRDRVVPPDLNPLLDRVRQQLDQLQGEQEAARREMERRHG